VLVRKPVPTIHAGARRRTLTGINPGVVFRWMRLLEVVACTQGVNARSPVGLSVSLQGHDPSVLLVSGAKQREGDL